jgi:group I intron endonuclease
MINKGIYKIRNKINGKFYIGSSIDINHRWTMHINSLKRGDHHSIILQRAWNKYGLDNFIFEIIEETSDYSLIEREQYYLDHLKPIYNISPTAGNCLGIKRSNKTKQLLRDINLGKKVTEETKKKISEGIKNSSTHKNAHNTDEYKEKMRALNLGENNPMWGKGIKGETNHMWGKFGKLHQRAKKISQYTKGGDFIRNWDSIADAARAGFSQSNISSCCAGKLTSAGGFIWKWLTD